jgi:hypothetical protein
MPNTAGLSGQNYFDSPIFNGPTPPEGAKAMAVNCPFTSQNTAFNIDLTLSQTQNYISLIQGVFIDNSENADVVSITSNGATNQKIEFPAGAQGYVPLLATKPTSFTVASAGAVTVPIIFLNVAVPAIIWGGASGGGGGGGAIDLINPGAQPSVASGSQVQAASDGSGNLMVNLQATNFDENSYAENQASPIYAYNNALLVWIYGQSNPLSITVRNANNWAHGQVLCTDTATIIVPQGQCAGPRVKNLGPDPVYIGADDSEGVVTTANGWLLNVGDEYDFSSLGGNWPSYVSGVCESGQTATVCWAGASL